MSWSVACVERDDENLRDPISFLTVGIRYEDI